MTDVDCLSSSDHSLRYVSSDDDSYLGIEEGFNRSTRREEERPRFQIAKKETKVVFYLKITVLVVLVIAAVFISTLTYFIIRREEQEDYETQFVDFSRKIIDSFYRSTNMKLWTANTLSATYTSYVMSATRENGSSSTSWPNVTLPDTLVRFAGARRLANASAITFSPYLQTDDTRREWETYATEWDQNQAFLPSFPSIGEGANDSGSLGATRPSGRHLQDGDNRDERTIADGIYDFDALGNRQTRRTGNAPYFPIWQISPENRNKASVMFDQKVDTKRRLALENLINIGGAVFSQILYNESSIPPPHVRSNEPRSIVYYPVVDSFYTRIRSGAIGIEYLWSNYFEDFPSQFDGMVIVLETTCGQQFTFEIQQGRVVFKGEHDLHDDEFDEMVQKSTYKGFHALCHYGYEFWAGVYDDGRRLIEEEQIEDVFVAQKVPEIDGLYSDGKDADEEDEVDKHTCHYAVRVYPSAEFQAKYLTSEPRFFAIAVAMIFVFAASVFIIYDCIVERRQSLTMQTAIRSTAVVDSLFPANVRDRMFMTVKKKENKASRRKNGDAWRNTLGVSDHTSRRRIEPPKLQLKSYLDSNETEPTESESAGNNRAPIADLFPATTVMFADIAGFTAWSSEREPKDVFALLETLFRAFDKIAKKLGVFKVRLHKRNVTNKEKDAVLQTKFTIYRSRRLATATLLLPVSLNRTKTTR